MRELKIETKGRLLAKLTWELITTTTEPFACLADLTEALKCRCERLRIRWTNEDISEAFALISTNHPLVFPRQVVRAPAAKPDDAPISPDEARLLLRKLGIIQQIKSVPFAKIRTDRSTARLKAAQFVAREITESIAQCEAIEAAARDSEDGPR